MLKKGLPTMLILAFVFSLCNASYAIEDIGEFDYWYSDSTRIGFHNPSSLKVYAQTDPDFGMSDSRFIEIIDHAVGAWDDFVSITSGATSGNYDVGIMGIDRGLADEDDIPGNVDGFTSINISSTYAKAGTKTVRLIDKATLYLIWDDEGIGDNVKTSDYTLSQWKGIIAHEYGHAIGYYGHNPNSSSLMYYSSTAIEPQTTDKRHIGNVY